MAYAVENALYQWREGERRIANAAEPAQADLEAAADVVVEALRRRLGSSFMVDELAELYAQDTDWALEIASRNPGGHRLRQRRGRRVRALRPRGEGLRGRAAAREAPEARVASRTYGGRGEGGRVPAVRRRSGIRGTASCASPCSITLVVIVRSYLSPARHWLQQSAPPGARSRSWPQLTGQKKRLRSRLRALRDPGALSARHAASGWCAWESAPT